MDINAKKWDARVGKATGWCHFLQSAEWAGAQDHTAWQPILTEVKSGTKAYPLALYNRTVTGLGELYLASKLASLKPAQAKSFTDGLKQLAPGGIAIKIDIDQPYDDKLHKALEKQGWRRSPSVQYRETVIIDLTKGVEQLLAGFKKGTRWEIKAGEKRGIKVQKVAVTPENMAIVYDLLSETYRRADFFTRSQQFTESYWRAFDKTRQGSMYIARLGRKPLAAAFVIHIGKRAFYKDGASVRIKPDVFASRVMQWHIMQDLIKQGIKSYDLCGISTRPNSELSGVTLFKTGFGEPIELQWGYELPLSAWRYRLWKKAAERVALKYSATIHKELWY